MSFLSNMPSRNAANFSLMFSGDARAGGQPAAGRTEYIALNDTSPPEGQVIGMCHGHSVLGYNWHQHVSYPPSDKQQGSKRPVSNVGSGGSISWVSSTASASKTALPPGDSPQSRDTERAQQGCGGGDGSIRCSGRGSIDSAESSCDNDNGVARAPNTAVSSLSRRTVTKAAAAAAAREPVDSITDAHGTVFAVKGEGSTRGLGRNLGARGLLGGSRAGSRGGSTSFSTAAGRGRREGSTSGEGDSPEQPVAAAAAAAATRGRVGMRKARRTYGR